MNRAKINTENNNISEDEYMFIKKVLPQKSFETFDTYTKNSDFLYETTLTVHGFRNYVDDFWLLDVFSRKGVVTTLDILTPDQQDIIRRIGKSKNQIKGNVEMSRDGNAEDEAGSDYAELSDLYIQMTTGSKDVIKECDLNVYVYAKSEKELEKKVQEVHNELNKKGFSNSIQLNLQDKLWKKSILPNKLINKEIPASTLGAGFFFNAKSLIDPNGIYFGNTFSGGKIVLDLFHKDLERISYDFLVIGKKGSGKSVLLKFHIVNCLLKGYPVIVFDIEKEYFKLAELFGGNIVSIDGKKGMRNILEIIYFNGNENEEDGTTVFQNHLESLRVFFQTISGSDEKVIRKLISCIDSFYEELKLKNIDYSCKNPIDFPTLSDLKVYLEKEVFELENSIYHSDMPEIKYKLMEEEYKETKEALMIINEIVKSYGKMFDGHSTLDLKNSKFTIFDFSAMSSSGGAESKVFKAQMINILNYCWQVMDHIRSNNVDKTFEEATRIAFVIDEATNYISTSYENRYIVKYFEQYIKRARKYLAGFSLAGHLISDFFPDSNSELAESVKKILALTTYKFIYKQDMVQIDTLSSVFKKLLNDSLLDQIPRLERGQAVLLVENDSYVFEHFVSQAEIDLYSGGF